MDNVQIKTIIDAVTRVLDVPSYRVAVAPKNQGGFINHAEKQTVWLLTMLSLVVVLSVYYIMSPESKNAVQMKSEKAAEKWQLKNAGS